MHQLLKGRLEAIRSAFMALYNGGVGMPKASNGTDRELFVSEFLAKVFPPHLRYVGGAIIDSVSSERSGQVDVAMLLPNAPSFAMPAGEERLMMAESVAAAFEVKSDLSTQWEQVLATTEKIKALRKHVRDLEIPGQCVVASIPVYAVGYKGWANVGTLKKKWENTPEEQRPDGVLMLENPAFVSATLQAESHAAIFAFIAHLSQSIKDHALIEANLFRYIGKPVIMPTTMA